MPESKDAANNTQDPAVQPEVVISLGQSQPVAAAPQPPVPAIPPVQPAPQPAPIAPPPQPTPLPPPQPTPLPQPTPQPQPSSSPFQPEQPEPTASAAETSESAVTWTATEFIDHDKQISWYVALAVAAVFFAALIYLIAGDAVSVAVVIVAALVFGTYGARKPRQLDYRVDQSGVTIGEKHRPYGVFKSYTVVPEGALSGIELMPLKRFAPIITIFFAPEDEQKILKVLSVQLPYEQPRHDAVDNLMRRIRF